MVRRGLRDPSADVCRGFSAGHTISFCVLRLTGPQAHRLTDRAAPVFSSPQHFRNVLPADNPLPVLSTPSWGQSPIRLFLRLTLYLAFVVWLEMFPLVPEEYCPWIQNSRG